MSSRNFTGSDAELFDYIRERANVRPPISWEQIADEIGVSVQDLLNWFVAYRAPKRDRDALRKKGPEPALIARNPGGGQWSLPAQAQRHAIWQRQRDGAKALGRGASPR